MLRPLADGLRAALPLSQGGREIDRLLKWAGDAWADGVPLISKAGAYSRTCAYRDENFEVLLLKWSAGAASAIHDHGGQRCWMMVLAGKLCVEDYVRLDRGNVPGYAHIAAEDSRTLEAGGLDVRAGRFDLHRVSATPDREAISLHVYAAPLHRYLIYDEFSRRCQPAFGTYDDVLSTDSLSRS